MKCTHVYLYTLTVKHYILHDLIHQLLVVVIATYNIIIIATIRIKTYLCVIAFNATFNNVSVILLNHVKYNV
jgi:hypothetical protein